METKSMKLPDSNTRLHKSSSNLGVKLGLSRNLWIVKSRLNSGLNSGSSRPRGKPGHLHRCVLSQVYIIGAYAYIATLKIKGLHTQLTF